MDENQMTPISEPQVVQEQSVEQQPQTPPPPSPEPPIIEPPSPKKSKLGLIIKILVALLIIFGGVAGGYWMVRRDGTKIISNKIRAFRNKGIEADWVDFENTDYGYKFSYPSDTSLANDEKMAYVYEAGADEPYMAQYFLINYLEYPPVYENLKSEEVEINGYSASRFYEEKEVSEGEFFYDIYRMDRPGLAGVFEMYVSRDPLREDLAKRILNSFELMEIERKEEASIPVVGSLGIARDSQRKAAVYDIANAIYMFASVNNGNLPGGSNFPKAKTCIGTSTECFDLYNIEGFSEQLPTPLFDPASGTADNSGYSVYQMDNGRIEVSAKSESDGAEITAIR